MGITERLDAVTHIPQDYLRADPPVPKSAKIELTSRCPYRCSYCVKSIASTADRTMDRALYSKLIRELRASGVRELGVFYIGESFAVKWLPEAIAEARDVGFDYVFVTTNGALATPQMVERCMESGLSSLKWSLNFADQDQFMRIARVKALYFDRVLEHIRRAHEIREIGGFACRLYASSILYDGEQGVKMHALVQRIRPWIDEHYYLPLFPMDGAAKAAGMQPGAGNPGRVGGEVDPIPCWGCFTSAHISVDGTLSACCFGNGQDGALVMGDLTRQSFESAWNSEAFQALRKAHLARDLVGTPCQTCLQN